MWESPAGLSQAVAGIHAFHGFPQLRHFQSGLAATFDLQDPDILNHYMLWAPTQNPEEPEKEVSSPYRIKENFFGNIRQEHS
jgi:hypothetical protein